MLNSVKDTTKKSFQNFLKPLKKSTVTPAFTGAMSMNAIGSQMLLSPSCINSGVCVNSSPKDNYLKLRHFTCKYVEVSRIQSNTDSSFYLIVQPLRSAPTPSVRFRPTHSSKMLINALIMPSR